MTGLPVVAVVGRPNVGKSTLVNRIIGSRSAVVEEMPGVTRDRRNFEADWAGTGFILVDTGGWETSPEGTIDTSIREQAEAAVSGADLVLLVVDATTELSEDDRGVVAILRRSGVPTIPVVNKVDNEAIEAGVGDFWALGLGEPQPVSAFHGRGIGELLDRVVALIPGQPPRDTEDSRPRVAIVGRPNVGKSTLLNRLIGEERVIVADTPGTTRDPIDVVVSIGDEEYSIVDTAGIRRRPQIHEDADFFAVLRAREAIEDADVALLVLDALEGVTQQDQRIAAEIVEKGAGLVVLVNKWDAVDEEQREATARSVGDRLGFIGWAPAIRISARTGARIGRLPEALDIALRSRSVRIPTGELNRKMREWVNAHPPPVRKGRRPKLQYAVQAGSRPPTIVLFISGGEIGDDYIRYLENKLRAAYDLEGTPVHFVRRERR
jgi:GTP-binding protein